MAQDAPEKRVTISAGFGLLTVPEVIEGVGDLLGTALTGGTVRYEDGSFTGALLVGVKFSTRTNFKFGIDGVYEKFTKKVYSQSSNQLLGESEGKYVSIIPRADYYWVNKRAVRFYSGIGAGVSFAEQKFDDDKANDVIFAFNVAPVGVELGTTIAFFGEVNFGYNGLINAGLRLRL